VLSEIGNYRDFQTPDQLAKWCGLNPGENESAGKRKMWNHKARFQAHQSCACQAAQTISRMKNTRLTRFFQRLSKKKEHNVAIIAVAGKLICLIYHLLINQELYKKMNAGRGDRVRISLPCTFISGGSFGR